jgi:hypothetical protein
MVIMTRYGLLGQVLAYNGKLSTASRAASCREGLILFAVDPPSMLYVEGLALHSA